MTLLQQIGQQIQRSGQRALDVVLPARCIGCGKPRTYLCGACIAAMDIPAPRTITSDSFAFDTATAAVAYDGLARDAVHRLKFKNLRAIAPCMAAPMASSISASANIDAVVPVPLHGSRLRERGYNQARLLAEPMAAHLGLPFQPDWLIRDRQRGRQVEAANVAARQANVRSAFSASSSAVAGLRLVLVDDVMTTGATLDAAATALKAAGAVSVHCATFARDA
jgi:competence protein ComFC